MNFNPDLSAAINRCISLNIPFCVYLMPNSNEPVFFASIPSEDEPNNIANLEVGSDWQGFVINFFSFIDNVFPIGIKRDLSVDDILSLPEDMAPLPEADIHPRDYSTPYPVYYAQVHEIKQQLKRSRGKTVLSRLVAVMSSNQIVDVVEKYFNEYPATFRHMYFTQETGLWFGATPEILANYDMASKNIMTMSLAGTRTLSSNNEPWDTKNIHEHAYVTDYILHHMEMFELNPQIVETSTVKFGNIEHLCDIIVGKGDLEIYYFVNMLSPTPAVCGMPVSAAFEQINTLEAHPRYCYGGWIGVVDGHSFQAFVNLRCALAANCSPQSVLYNLYAGGGLVQESDAASEWLEAALKMKSLYNIINDGNSLPHPSFNEISVGSLLDGSKQ